MRSRCTTNAVSGAGTTSVIASDRTFDQSRPFRLPVSQISACCAISTLALVNRYDVTLVAIPIPIRISR